MTTTLAAKGILPEDHPLSLGNCGFAGTPRANGALLGTAHDLLLMIGADFDERTSLAWHRDIRRPGRRIVRLDTRRFHHGSPIEVDLELIEADIAARLDALSTLTPRELGGPRARPAPPPPDDQDEHLLKNKHRLTANRADLDQAPTLRVRDVIVALQQSLDDSSVLVVDGGMVRIFAGQVWQARRPGGFHSATSTAPTGWAIAAGVGLQLGEPSRDIAVVTGDGCMLMHGVELATAARYGLPLVLVVLDNGGHGAVLRRAPARPLEHLVRTAPVDWPAFARSLGAGGVTLRHTDELPALVRQTLSGHQPLLVHVRTSTHETYPASEHVFLSYSSFLQK